VKDTSTKSVRGQLNPTYSKYVEVGDINERLEDSFDDDSDHPKKTTVNRLSLNRPKDDQYDQYNYMSTRTTDGNPLSRVEELRNFSGDSELGHFFLNISNTNI
jgi:hypothetical protein